MVPAAFAHGGEATVTQPASCGSLNKEAWLQLLNLEPETSSCSKVYLQPTPNSLGPIHYKLTTTNPLYSVRECRGDYWATSHGVGPGRCPERGAPTCTRKELIQQCAIWSELEATALSQFTHYIIDLLYWFVPFLGM